MVYSGLRGEDLIGLTGQVHLQILYINFMFNVFLHSWFKVSMINFTTLATPWSITWIFVALLFKLAVKKPKIPLDTPEPEVPDPRRRPHPCTCQDRFGSQRPCTNLSVDQECLPRRRPQDTEPLQRLHWFWPDAGPIGAAFCRSRTRSSPDPCSTARPSSAEAPLSSQ